MLSLTEFRDLRVCNEEAVEDLLQVLSPLASPVQAVKKEDG